MSMRQRGLGRGLGALIAPAAPSVPAVPSAPPAPALRPVAGGPTPSDVFFNGSASIRIPESGPTSPPAGSVDHPAVEPETAGQVVGELRMLPVAAIGPNPRQPRTVFDEDALEELAASIREVGVLQPVVVRTGAGGRGGPDFELVMGERRWRASQLAGLDEVPAVIRTTSDDNLLREALLENLHRSELNPLEEAAAYGQLLHDFGCTHEELAKRLGTSRSHLTNTMRLLGLSPAVQRRVAAGVLTAGHARALLTLDDPSAQDALAGRIVAEGLSVRAVEELVAVAQPRRRRSPAGTPPPEAPELTDIAAQLTDRLDTRVKVVMGRSKGKITVEFAGVEDLQRILAAMSPGAPQN
jgi:ParB family transcriptional regulator, chromosome partitioning protein